MKLHRAIARAFGYELIKRRKSPTTDTHLINLIHHHGIDLVLDVGANQGQFGAMLRREGYAGEIHSFEPVSHTFRQLEAAAAGDAYWHAHPLALGAEAGTAEVNVSASSDLSSFLQANEFGRERYRKIETTRQETVTIGTLDRVLPSLASDYADRRILLKMDTQGFDLQVFEGAGQMIPHLCCMLSELSLLPIYAGMPHYLEALRIYEDAGFAITGLFPISRDSDLAVVEMDCFMVNRKAVGRT